MSRVPPRIKSHDDAEKAFREVIDRLLKLEGKIGTNTGNVRHTSGEPGSIRSVKKSDGSTAIQVKTKEGWFEVDGLTLQEKE